MEATHQFLRVLKVWLRQGLSFRHAKETSDELLKPGMLLEIPAVCFERPGVACDGEIEIIASPQVFDFAVTERQGWCVRRTILVEAFLSEPRSTSDPLQFFLGYETAQPQVTRHGVSSRADLFGCGELLINVR